MYEELRPYLEHIQELNEIRLLPGFLWSVDDVEAMLLNAGFSKITERGADQNLYAGTSMLLCAMKD